MDVPLSQQSGEGQGALPHFAARGGGLVHLVCLVSLVYLVQRTK